MHQWPACRIICRGNEVWNSASHSTGRILFLQLTDERLAIFICAVTLAGRHIRIWWIMWNYRDLLFIVDFGCISLRRVRRVVQWVQATLLFLYLSCPRAPIPNFPHLFSRNFTALSLSSVNSCLSDAGATVHCVWAQYTYCFERLWFIRCEIRGQANNTDQCYLFIRSNVLSVWVQNTGAQSPHTHAHIPVCVLIRGSGNFVNLIWALIFAQVQRRTTIKWPKL